MEISVIIQKEGNKWQDAFSSESTYSLSVQRKGLMKTLEITTFRFDTSDISGGRETGKILLTLWEMNTVGGVSLSYGQRRKSQCLVYHASVSIS